MKTFLKLNNISAYKKALLLANYVRNSIIGWDNFAKNTIGRQFVKAVDSVSANIAEGFGRYTKKDKVNFYHISFGSVKESLDWNEKAKARKLLTAKEYEYILCQLTDLPREINNLIRFTNEKLKK